ncbi:immediate early response 3-interacting protein 1 [Galendromus occidentalis]|uniref:Immediate early response 3-interacting protein 1 n=1 Tax=Galendromus occidentalis TaxID=34638 RepID=A0AAJ6QVV5_9ACAR|nr:immediate early response 3-interacting protein 1 [Galendromus occidentalis]
MGFGIYSLLEAGLLVLNAVTILHEERFLNKYGLGRNMAMQGYQQPGAKTQIINLIHSVKTVMKVPLIFLNLMTILLEMLFG